MITTRVPISGPSTVMSEKMPAVCIPPKLPTLGTLEAMVKRLGRCEDVEFWELLRVRPREERLSWVVGCSGSRVRNQEKLDGEHTLQLSRKSGA
jgi:hypothetical protein